MDEELRTIVDMMAQSITRIYRYEPELGERLRAGDDKLRSEVAFYLDDAIRMSPDLPIGKVPNFGKIEELIGHAIGLADWQALSEELDDMVDDLHDYDYDIMDELKGAP